MLAGCPADHTNTRIFAKKVTIARPSKEKTRHLVLYVAACCRPWVGGSQDHMCQLSCRVKLRVHSRGVQASQAWCERTQPAQKLLRLQQAATVAHSVYKPEGDTTSSLPVPLVMHADLKHIQIGDIRPDKPPQLEHTSLHAAVRTPAASAPAPPQSSTARCRTSAARMRAMPSTAIKCPS
jgi:hypothetical protein